MRAEDAAGNLSDPSNPASVVVPDTEDPAPPGQPRGERRGRRPGAARVGGGHATTSAWPQYEVYRDDQLIATIDPATSYSDAVGPGSYSYYLRALDPSGNTLGPEQHRDRHRAPASTTRSPARPANLTRTAAAGKVDLEWDAATDNRAVTGYEIRRDGTLVATVGAVTSWSDTNVAAPQHLRVRRARPRRGRERVRSEQHRERDGARHPEAEPARRTCSATATATPGRPHMGRGRPTTWPSPATGSTATAPRSRTSAPVTSYSDTSVTAPGYDYAVRALDAAGNLSDPSNTATATVPDAQKPTVARHPQRHARPARTRSTSPGRASSDNIGVTGYEIYRNDALIATTGHGDVVRGQRRRGQHHLHLRGPRAGRRRQRLGPQQHRRRDHPGRLRHVHVRSGGRRARVRPAATGTNYATSNLRVDGGSNPAVESLLRFTVTGAPAGSVRSAKLRVYAYSGTVDGPAVFTTNPAWTETAVNWNNRPPRTSATTDDKGAIADQQLGRVRRDAFVTGNGTYSFGLAGTSTDGVDFYSREAATAAARAGRDDRRPRTPRSRRLRREPDRQRHEREPGRPVLAGSRPTTSA